MDRSKVDPSNWDPKVLKLLSHNKEKVGACEAPLVCCVKQFACRCVCNSRPLPGIGHMAFALTPKVSLVFGVADFVQKGIVAFGDRAFLETDYGRKMANSYVPRRPPRVNVGLDPWLPRRAHGHPPLG